MFSGVSFADEMSVEVTSYVNAGARTRGAELCGKINNMSGPWVIAKLKVDADQKNPAYYTTLVGSEAKFCVVVVTNGGNAEVSLASLNGKALGSRVKAKIFDKGRD